MSFLKFSMFVAVILLSFTVVGIGAEFDENGFEDFIDHPIPFDGKNGYIAYQDFANSSNSETDARIYIFLPLVVAEMTAVYSLNDVAHLCRTKAWNDSTRLIGIPVPVETYRNGTRSVLSMIQRMGYHRHLPTTGFRSIADIRWLFCLVHSIPSSTLTPREVSVVDKQIFEILSRIQYPTLHMWDLMRYRVRELVKKRIEADLEGVQFDCKSNSDSDPWIEQQSRAIFYSTAIQKFFLTYE